MWSEYTDVLLVTPLLWSVKNNLTYNINKTEILPYSSKYIIVCIINVYS